MRTKLYVYLTLAGASLAAIIHPVAHVVLRWFGIACP
jgi:hypothetical protein